RQRGDRPLVLSELELQVHAARRGSQVLAWLYLLELDVEACWRDLLFEQRCRLDETCEDRRGGEGHVDCAVTGRLQERLSLLDVLALLRKAAGKQGQPLASDVVTERAEPVKRVVD